MRREGKAPPGRYAAVAAPNGQRTDDEPWAGRGRYRVAWLLMQQAVKLPRLIRPSDAPFSSFLYLTSVQAIRAGPLAHVDTLLPDDGFQRGEGGRQVWTTEDTNITDGETEARDECNAMS